MTVKHKALIELKRTHELGEYPDGTHSFNELSALVIQDWFACATASGYASLTTKPKVTVEGSRVVVVGRVQPSSFFRRNAEKLNSIYRRNVVNAASEIGETIE